MKGYGRPMVGGIAARESLPEHRIGNGWYPAHRRTDEGPLVIPLTSLVIRGWPQGFLILISILPSKKPRRKDGRELRMEEKQNILITTFEKWCWISLDSLARAFATSCLWLGDSCYVAFIAQLSVAHQDFRRMIWKPFFGLRKNL